ncbi:MAG: ABC-F family ATP-binding cassette domain-containing protein [Chloroflexi bacterium]|nr:ABC-F family ATP-binding cassette domain-containing protein [Chloroflexota bacterium]
MLRIEHLRKDYGGQRVLEDTSLALKPGERAALVAPNGAGKSTLLKIVAGLEEPDAGRVLVPAGLVVGYLAQDAGVQPGRSLHDEVLSAVSDLLAIEDTMRSLEHDISSADADRLDTLVHEHAELQEQFERRGGYAIEAEIGRVLAGLGFSEADRTRQTQEFSGGWQMRIALARLLLGRPDILLLDEPTNHLDLAATEWLEDYVKASRATLLIVSHDRYFLDSVIQRVFELREGRVETFPAGNYSAYRVERARRDEAQQDIAQRQQEEIERVEAYIRRYKEGNRATMAKSREKMLARLEAERVTVARPDRVVKFTFPACPPSGREVVTLSHASRAYGERLVLEDVNLVVERGERVALIGPNGAGKSTLLRLLAGKDRPSRGSASLGVGVRPAYFAQDQAEHLDPANTAFDEVYQAAPASWDIQAVRDLLGRFLFHGEAQFKSVATLSGGERSRVALAKLLLRPNNLLLLDEPTNHLDIATRERLEDTLSAFTGTLIVATHDRYLVNRLATQVIEVADGRIRVYPGTYADYQRAKRADTQSESPVSTISPSPAGSASASTPSARSATTWRAAEAVAREPDPAVRRRLAAELREAERAVTSAEDRLKSIEAALSDPASHAGDLARLGREHAALQSEVETLTARWAELAEAAEGAA